MKAPQLLVVAIVGLTVAGCSSSALVSWDEAPSSKERQTSRGWARSAQPSDREAAPQTPEAEVESAGICFVKAPNLPDTEAEMVQVLKRPERHVAGTDIVIAAEYVSVETVPELEEGFSFIPAVCEESIDRRLVIRVQEALIERGYDIGAADGLLGPGTSAGLEYFKRDNGIYGDGLTHEVLEALGIDPQTGGTGFASL